MRGKPMASARVLPGDRLLVSDTGLHIFIQKESHPEA